jgi:hypothetical protein
MGVHAYVVNSLPGEAEAGERLKQTALRDFGPFPEMATSDAGMIDSMDY